MTVRLRENMLGPWPRQYAGPVCDAQRHCSCSMQSVALYKPMPLYASHVINTVTETKITTITSASCNRIMKKMQLQSQQLMKTLESIFSLQILQKS